jgi:hypothetical protein
MFLALLSLEGSLKNPIYTEFLTYPQSTIDKRKGFKPKGENSNETIRITVCC